jgi:hypothetical protein
MDKEAFMAGYGHKTDPIESAFILGAFCKEAGLFNATEEEIQEYLDSPLSKEASAEDILFDSFIHGYMDKEAIKDYLWDSNNNRWRGGFMNPVNIIDNMFEAPRRWNSVVEPIQNWSNNYQYNKLNDPTGQNLPANLAESRKQVMRRGDLYKKPAANEGQTWVKYQAQQLMQSPAAKAAIHEASDTATDRLKSNFKNELDAVKGGLGGIFNMENLKKYLPWLLLGGGGLMALSGMGRSQPAPRPYPMPMPMYPHPMMGAPNAFRSGY